jgi:CRP/FNR family cyclic AMP-dependent transcriptional regulator
MAGDRRERPSVRPSHESGSGWSAMAKLPFLAGVEPDSLGELAPSARWQTVAAGELVLDFGDTSTEVFIVADGVVRVVVRTELGQEVILGELGSGEIFGEMAAIDGAPRSASVTALHPTRLCRIPASQFMQLVLRFPEIGLRLLRVLTARLRMQDERMTELALLPARLRLAAELLRLSRPRSNGTARVISPPLPHHVLASRIGARRETVTLALADLARANLVQVSPQAIVLPRPDALRQAIDTQMRSGLKALRQPVEEGAGDRQRTSSAMPQEGIVNLRNL